VMHRAVSLDRGTVPRTVVVSTRKGHDMKAVMRAQRACIE
jgi:hypothetical protein